MFLLFFHKYRTTGTIKFEFIFLQINTSVLSLKTQSTVETSNNDVDSLTSFSYCIRHWQKQNSDHLIYSFQILINHALLLISIHVIKVGTKSYDVLIYLDTINTFAATTT